MSNLITTTPALKEILGGAVNSGIEIESLQPFLTIAEENYLLPYVPQRLVDTLSGVSPDMRLLQLYKNVLAFMALYEYAPIGNLQFTESGLQRVVTDTIKTAFKYQENAYRDKVKQTGMNYLEQIIQYMYLQRSTLLIEAEITELFSEWFVFLASDFRKLYSHSLSRETYEILRPLIWDVQLFAIKKAIGAATYDFLLAQRHNAALSDTIISHAIILVKKAIVNFAVVEGMKRHYVRLEGSKVIMNERGDSQSYEYERAVTADQAGLVISNDRIMANRYIIELVEHLDAYPDSFTGWPIATDSEETTDPSVGPVIFW